MAETQANPANGSLSSSNGNDSGWLFGNRDFLKLFFGSLAGKLGERLYQMAIIMAVVKAFPDTTEHIALITLAGVLPQFFLFPLIGKLIDSVDRRRILWSICLISAVCVWFLAPLLLLDPKLAQFREHWNQSLYVVFILSTIFVAFGPARASALPDVVSGPKTGIAASVIATSGLVAILLGSVIGGYLSYKFGSLGVLPFSCGLYLAGALSMRLLPNSVAIPGTNRGEAAQKSDASAGEGAGKIGAYLRDNWEGLKYCFRTKGVIALILFETTFWLCAVSFYNICDWHAAAGLHLDVPGRQFYFSIGLGCAGIGLFLGALLIGKYCRALSPIFTYAPSYLFIGAAMWVIFNTTGHANPGRAVLEFSERYQKQEFLDELPEAEREEYRALATGIAQNKDERVDVSHVETVDKANGQLVSDMLFWLFLLGLGGGMMLGRVDADILAITEASMRGRVFSIKGFGFTGALLVPLLLFWLNKAGDTRLYVSYYVPAILMLAAAPVLVLSWMLDVGIYAHPSKLNLGGPIERATFYTARFIAWCIAKVYFRIHIEGRDKVPDEGPVMLVANHGSFLDPVWLGICMKRRVQYIMHSMYYYSWAHPFFRFMICIPVDEASQIRALKEGSKALAQGICIGMFPEGTVTRTGQMGKPKMGAMFLAQRAKATVVPCAIVGNTTAFPRSAKFPKPSKITILVGEPFKISEDASREEIARVSDKAMAEIAKMLGTEPPPSCMEDLKDRKRPKDGDGHGGEFSGASPTPIPQPTSKA